MTKSIKLLLRLPFYTIWLISTLITGIFLIPAIYLLSDLTLFDSLQEYLDSIYLKQIWKDVYTFIHKIKEVESENGN